MVSRGSFLPHAVCLDYGPLMWLHALSDGVIGLSFYSIPVSLMTLAWRRQDFEFRWVAVMFGAFILLCGSTHIMHVWTLFVPDYLASGALKAVTAVVSLATAVALWLLLPKVLVISSHRQLALVNQDLRRQLVDRETINAELEQRVGERTRQLEDLNRALTLEVAQRSEAETASRHAQAEAERANRGKSRMVAGVSHDLRQPVQAMFYFTEALASRLSDAAGRAILGDLERSMTTLKSLLDSLLDMSKLEAGSITPQFQDFEVGTLLEQLAAEFAPMAVGKGLRLTVVPSTVAVHSDPALLGRILGNLAANAVRYTDSGGIVIGCRRRGDRLACEVWDTGVGIAADQQNRIFEEFAQVDGSADERGFGLGLAIVRRLCGLLNHDIRLRSLPGRGSVFSVTVPMIADRARRAA
ncbi:MAG TPA: HAMP domain-containing histidine kinase [Rhodospirillaceae bacterium]|nr:HAMP domain-containing histidine kinase [Rhodospirillaceae bacterium]